jgi:hypothetical protein
LTGWPRATAMATRRGTSLLTLLPLFRNFVGIRIPS